MTRVATSDLETSPFGQPQDPARPRFTQVRHGYDRDEVDRHLDELTEQITRLHSEIDWLTARSEHLVRRSAAAEEAAYTRVSRQFAEAIAAADHELGRMRSVGTQEAARIREEAEREAAGIRAGAQREAAQLRAHAMEDADRLIRAAREEAARAPAYADEPDEPADAPVAAQEAPGPAEEAPATVDQELFGGGEDEHEPTGWPWNASQRSLPSERWPISAEDIWGPAEDPANPADERTFAAGPPESFEPPELDVDLPRLDLWDEDDEGGTPSA